MTPASAVALLLAAGMTPAEIDAAMHDALKRQAKDWCSHPHSGGWRKRTTCQEHIAKAFVARVDSQHWSDPSAVPQQHSLWGE